MFKYSLIGSTVSVFSFIFFGLKISDQEAKKEGFSYADEENPTQEEFIQYNILETRTNKRIDELRIYQNISSYVAIATLISAGVFYYLDIAQDDIDIAFYNPQPERQANLSGMTSNCLQRGIGIKLNFRF